MTLELWRPTYYTRQPVRRGAAFATIFDLVEIFLFLHQLEEELTDPPPKRSVAKPRRGQPEIKVPTVVALTPRQGGRGNTCMNVGSPVLSST